MRRVLILLGVALWIWLLHYISTVHTQKSKVLKFIDWLHHQFRLVRLAWLISLRTLFSAYNIDARWFILVCALGLKDQTRGTQLGERGKDCAVCVCESLARAERIKGLSQQWRVRSPFIFTLRRAQVIFPRWYTFCSVYFDVCHAEGEKEKWKMRSAAARCIISRENGWAPHGINLIFVSRRTSQWADVCTFEMKFFSNFALS